MKITVRRICRERNSKYAHGLGHQSPQVQTEDSLEQLDASAAQTRLNEWENILLLYYFQICLCSHATEIKSADPKREAKYGEISGQDSLLTHQEFMM